MTQTAHTAPDYAAPDVPADVLIGAIAHMIKLSAGEPHEGTLCELGKGGCGTQNHRQYSISVTV